MKVQFVQKKNVVSKEIQYLPLDCRESCFGIGTSAPWKKLRSLHLESLMTECIVTQRGSMR